MDETCRTNIEQDPTSESGSPLSVESTETGEGAYALKEDHFTFFSPFFEIGLMVSMLVTLIIPSNITNIDLWMNISPLLLIRTSFWLLGLSLLPGIYLLRLTGFSETLSNISTIAIGINLSFLFIGVTTLLLYYIQGSILLLPWLILIILGIMFALTWHKSKINPRIRVTRPSKWIVLLGMVMAANISIAFFVQLSQQFLVKGDLWVSLNSAVYIISQNAPFRIEYPIMFGYILAGLSVCSGLPIVNTYVLLFPLIALNALSFFALLKIVLKINDRISAVASAIYIFSGGFGWLIQTLIYQGQASLWDISVLTHDMYWSLFFRHTIYFSYKLLALTLAYMALVTFKLTLESTDRNKWMATIILSSLFMSFSFFIHMIEPIIFIPVIFVMALIHKRGRSGYKSVAALSLITIFIYFSIDFLTHGWYSQITLQQLELKGFSSPLTYFFVLGTLGITVLVGYFLHRQPRKLDLRIRIDGSKYKALIVGGLLVTYLGTLLFLKPSRHVGYLPFPWYSHAARYGFVGILAIIGIRFSKWDEKWFQMASLWCLIAISIGVIWWQWGSRMNNYQFPMLALLAAVAVDGIWDQPYPSNHFSIKGHRFSGKPIARIIVIAVLALSSTSLFYGMSFYTSQQENAWMAGPSLSEDQVRLVVWIYQNTPVNITVLVPGELRHSAIYRGVEGISNRHIYLSNELPAVSSDIIETLAINNIRYAVTVNDETTPVLRALLSHSTLVFQSGNVKAFELPTVIPHIIVT